MNTTPKARGSNLPPAPPTLCRRHGGHTAAPECVVCASSGTGKPVPIPLPFSGMVARLKKPGAQFLKQLTAERILSVRTALALAVDVGERVDQTKKWVVYSAPPPAGGGAPPSGTPERVLREGEAILGALTPTMADLLHAAMGIVGEACEVAEAVLNATPRPGAPTPALDLDNVVEELGDLEFYLEQFRQALDLERSHVLQRNQDKLRRRYPTGNYTDQQAIDRADKRGEGGKS